MRINHKYHIESIPYGTREITVQIPKQNYFETLAPPYHVGVKDEEKEIIRALQYPIGSPRLSEIIKKKKGRKTVVVVNDGTRPTATHKLLPPLMEHLEGCGIPDHDIFILIATGSHREVQANEFEGLLGKEIANRYHVVNHHCQEMENMVNLGITSQGVPIIINRSFYKTDLKILTSSIHPHQAAGFSGGRKSILPGLASLETLKLHHSYKFRSPRPAMGWLEGNPFHLAALEAAKRADPDFILNIVQNQKKEITCAVAGDVEKAWLSGVDASRKIFETKAPHDMDIVIASPGGHPRDVSLYQSQKSMAVAELIVKKGGTIILPVACPDGVGSDGFYEWMASASCPEEVVERFKREEYSIGTSKAGLYSRCLMRAELIIFSDCLDERTLANMFTKKAPDLETAINMALEKHGQDAKILLMKNAPDIIPKLKN